MRAALDSYLIGFDAPSTPVGQALVRERYAALKGQVPIIYVLIVANLWGLELATTGEIKIGLNFPTVLSALALVRTVQWIRSKGDFDHRTTLRELRKTCLLTAILSVSICVWCMSLLPRADEGTRLAVILFGGFTAIGSAFGLSAFPSAARMPIFALALPLAAVGLFSDDPRFVGAALSLACIGALFLRLLSVQNSHFTDLIESRATVANEREIAESAREQAVLAATTDFLTGLPNRRAFLTALDKEIGRDNAPFAVAILDLDNFKQINDTLGHPTGDSILEIVAARLLSVSGANITAARLGGDEFGLIIKGFNRQSKAKAAGTKILAEVAQVAVANGRETVVEASMGVALRDKSVGASSLKLLAEADLALYEAKRSRTPVVVFERSMEAPYLRRVEIERSLRMPDVRERLHVLFQPIVDLQTGKVIANEALARWKDTKLGDVSPAEFIPLAEQLNLIGGIGDHLMQQAMAEASPWPQTAALALNLSALQLCSPQSADSILRSMKDADLSPQRLHVEVTETALLADFDRARKNLEKLKSAGVTIVLDDFGAGFSSIGYLRELTFDQIKLDGTLITAAQQSANGERLLAATIGLCQALGVVTVAEHIENEEQFKLVIKLGCSAGQGFWLHAPLTGVEAGNLLRASDRIDARSNQMRARLVTAA